MMSTRKAGRLGGIEAARRMTPEDRTERARHAHLRGSVATVVRRAAELTTQDVEDLMNALRAAR